MKTAISVIFMVLINFFLGNQKQAQDPLIDWMQVNSSELETLGLNDTKEDFQLLGKIVGDAKLVCLGESRHDAREQFLLKHRLIKYLVEEKGFNTFILEASLPYAERINRFILHNEGNLEEIMADMPGWFLWDTEEMQDIIEWMRTYNSNPENLQKINFFGIDIVAPNDGLDQIFSYIQKVDRRTYESLQNKSFGREYIDDTFWPNTSREYEGLSIDYKRILAINYDELYSILQAHETEYISQSSEAEYEWMLQLAFCAKMANAMFSAETRMEMGLIRDHSMAENVFWINEKFRESKMIIWAHNVHTTMSKFTMSLEEGSIKGMGSILKDELGDDMVSIGGAYNQGYFADEESIIPPADSNTIDAVLARAGMEYAIFDLNGVSENEDVTEWLNTPQRIQARGFEMTCIPIKCFDAFYFTESITKTRLNQLSVAHLRSMR